jgi:hypothetical protein
LPPAPFLPNSQFYTLGKEEQNGRDSDQKPLFPFDFGKRDKFGEEKEGLAGNGIEPIPQMTPSEREGGKENAEKSRRKIGRIYDGKDKEKWREVNGNKGKFLFEDSCGGKRRMGIIYFYFTIPLNDLPSHMYISSSFSFGLPAIAQHRCKHSLRFELL